jgi:choline-sulfatase
MSDTTNNQNKIGIARYGYYAVAGLLLAALEVVISFMDGQPGLNNSVEIGLFVLIIFGMGSCLSLATFLLVWISRQISTLILKSLYRTDSIPWKRIPHFVIFVVIWIISFVNYWVIKYFLEHFHNHSMISFSLAAIQFFAGSAAMILVALVTVLSQANKERKRKAIVQRICDFVINPYFISILFMLILLHANYDWISIVLNLRVLWELIIYGLLLMLLSYSSRGVLHRFWNRNSVNRFFGFLSVCLFTGSLLTLNYSYNLPARLHKNTAVTGVILRSAGRLLPLNTLPALIKSPIMKGHFDIQTYFSQTVQQFPYDSRPIRDIIGDTSNWNVIVISIDAVRADHLSCYGYPFTTTPNLDAFARESVLFERNYIQGGDSPNSINSFMSGIYPRNFRHFETQMLKDTLKENGYRTAFVGYEALFKGHPFRENYDEMHMFDTEYGEIWGQQTSETIVDAMIQTLKKIQGGKFFLYTHMLDPHEAYLPSIHSSRFSNSETPHYDGEIAYTDLHLGTLFQYLKDQNLYERTLIVITADHGEEFSDHGDRFHGKHLYTESIHTPMIINYPHLPERRVKLPVGSVDMAPTVLSFLDITPRNPLDGTDLLPLIYHGDATRLHPVFSMVPSSQYRKYGVIFGPWKLVFTRNQQTFELFNIDTDPDETQNQIDMYIPLAENLRDYLEEAYGQISPIPPIGSGVKTGKSKPEEKTPRSPLSDSYENPDTKIIPDPIATLKEPRDVDFGPQGTYAVADFRGYRIAFFDENGQFLRAFGTKGSKPGQFNDLCGVCYTDDGFIYIADTFNHRVQKCTDQGQFIWTASYVFDFPRDLCAVPDGIWVTDYGHDKLVKLDNDGAVLKILGGTGSGPLEFSRPVGINVDQHGNLYIADRGNKRVQILDPDGYFKKSIPVDGWKDHSFNLPYLCLDDYDHLYVSDPPSHRILVFETVHGSLISQFPPLDSTAESPFLFPMGLDYDPLGKNLAVVDCRHNRVLVFEIESL